MQKIQFYLVPNRITVTTDRVGFNTEFRKVYQRKLKLYKGTDNAIQIDVRNSEQRKQNVVGYTADVLFFDSEHKKLFEVTATPIVSQPGQLSMVIPTATLDDVDPQQLLMAVRLVDGDDDTTPLYIDGQFELFGSVEVLNGYNELNAAGTVIEELTVFNYEFDRKEYVSEVGRFGNSINDDIGATRTITVDYEGTYEGGIIVEATRDKSTANSVTWTNIGVWDTGVDTTKTLTGDWRFVRFRIFRNRGSGAGSGARFAVTKTAGVYSAVTPVLRGQNYLVGDTLTILGSFLGGVNGLNDITVTVTGLINGVTTQGNIDTISWTGTGTSGSNVYESIGTDPVGRPPNPIDKIRIRN
jgi:hypothetical protein